MKVLVTGADGQLGRELVRLGRSADFEIHGLNRQQLDITNKSQIQQILARISPSVVINAAAYTHVDRAENESALAYAVNKDGPAYLARCCADNQLALIHISTDYVFDGTKGRPYRESDPIAPLGVYGRSKAQGEMAIRNILPNHIIVRTAWLYGWWPINSVLRPAQRILPTHCWPSSRKSAPTKNLIGEPTIIAAKESQPGMVWPKGLSNWQRPMPP